jgi:hypothetical protein
LGIVYRRVQEHLHSPDPGYGRKIAGPAGGRGLRRPRVLLYLDDVTHDRHPEAAASRQSR